MDLLFTRYASPFLLLDNLILTCSLNGFIDEFFTIINEEKREQTQWEYFLHRSFDKTWAEFKKEIDKSNNEDDTHIDLGATLVKSKNMLNNFTPESEVE